MNFKTSAKNSRRIPILIGILFAVALLPLKQTFGLTQGELVSGGSVWLETTIAVALSFVSVMAFSLQIARGYFIRVLNKFTLRLGADIWWLAYVLIRDGLLFMTFVMGLLVFFPGTFLDYPIAVPFMPASIIMFGAALLTKLYFDADDNRRAFRAVTVFSFLGTALWIFGIIFVTETPLALATYPTGVSGTSGLWYTLFQTFSSTSTTPGLFAGVTGLDLAMMTFQATFPILGVFGLLGFAHPLLHSRLPKLKKAVESKVTASIPTSTPSITHITKPATKAD